MASAIGKKIRAERKRLGYSLDTLAELTDSSKSYIWELENKNDVNPTAEKVMKLAKHLEVPVEYLLNDNQQELTTSDSAKVFFRRFENLTEEKKQTLEALLNHLDNESKP